MSAIFFAFRKVGFAFYMGCMGNSRNLFFPFIDDINSGSSQCACYQILPVEGFAKSDTISLVILIFLCIFALEIN